MFLVGHDRGVWIKLNSTCLFFRSNQNRKFKPILIDLIWNTFKVYPFEKSESLAIKLSSIHSISRSNQCCDLEDCTWNWYLDYDSYGLAFLLFFGIFSCFTRNCLVFVLYQITIHVIYILILSINFTLIILIFVFNQSFLRNLFIQNITPDHHNLWVQSDFESNFEWYFLLILIKTAEHLNFVYTVWENLIWSNQRFQRKCHESAHRWLSIEFSHHLSQLILCLFEWQRWLVNGNHIIIMFIFLRFIYWCDLNWLFMRRIFDTFRRCSRIVLKHYWKTYLM